MSFKFSTASFKAPTPDKIRKAANAVISGCSAAGGGSALSGYVKIGIAIFVIGVIAKIVSNFYSDDDVQKS
jgi:hypothetical protein